MKLETAHTSHVGGRDEQQDAVAVYARSNGEILMVLADGMGGHAGGSVASKTVIDVAERKWQETEKKRQAPRDLLAGIVSAAHEEINKEGDDQGLAPRSTCVLLHLNSDKTPGKATWAHIGDSRLYRFRDGQLLGRTRDHSVVQMLVDLGKIAEDEMATHPDQNRLTHSLGGEAPPQPEFGEDDVQPGDIFLLCSDGLWEMVKPDEMLTALAGKDMEARADLLAKMAFERAGKGSDNISVAIARAGGESAVAAARNAVGAPAAEPAPKKRAGRRAKGRPALAFAVVTLLAVAAAAAVVQPWKGFDETAPKAVEPVLAPMPTKPAMPAPAPSERKDPAPDTAPKPEGKPEPEGKQKPDAKPTTDPTDAKPAPKSPDAGQPETEPARPPAAEPDGTDSAPETKPQSEPETTPRSE